MPTMIYRLADNTRVPSVTTVNAIGKDAGPLIHWSWSLGIDGIDYRKVRDDAAEAGTLGHAMVDAALHGTELDLSKFGDETKTAAAQAFSAYQEWRRQTKMEIIASEIPLVSEQYRYGGTMDAIAKQNGKYVLGDWKSGALYPDHLCQMAAYKNLWDEHSPKQKIEGFHLCRFNKTTGDFTHAYFSDLSEAWEAFIYKRKLYDLLAKLKKRV